MHPITHNEDIYCCHVCFVTKRRDTDYPFMIVCNDCGNKRCPKATDHRLDCTASNEPGQSGSIYE